MLSIGFVQLSKIVELYDHLSNRVDTLKEKCRLSLKDMGFSEKSIHYEIYLNMRYSRQVVFSNLFHSALPKVRASTVCFLSFTLHFFCYCRKLHAHIVTHIFFQQYLVRLRLCKIFRTDCALMCCSPAGWNGNFDCYGETFEKSYKREFGFTLPNRDIIVDDVR